MSQKQMKRSPLKRSSSLSNRGAGLKRTGKLKARKKKVEQVEQDKEDQQKMWELFDKHWLVKTKQGGRHYCESCDETIWGENKTIYHDHLLEKGTPKYEHLKYEIDNLYLVCWDCHTKKTNGFPTENHKNAIENAKKKLVDPE